MLPPAAARLRAERHPRTTGRSQPPTTACCHTRPCRSRSPSRSIWPHSQRCSGWTRQTSIVPACSNSAARQRGNIIPLAARFPRASFRGIDLSQRHIDEGRKRIAELALDEHQPPAGRPDHTRPGRTAVRLRDLSRRVQLGAQGGPGRHLPDLPPDASRRTGSRP